MPATGAIAAMRSESWHPSTEVMNAPFDRPVALTRLSSMQWVAST